MICSLHSLNLNSNIFWYYSCTNNHRNCNRKANYSKWDTNTDIDTFGIEYLTIEYSKYIYQNGTHTKKKNSIEIKNDDKNRTDGVQCDKFIPNENRQSKWNALNVWTKNVS